LEERKDTNTVETKIFTPIVATISHISENERIDLNSVVMNCRRKIWIKTLSESFSESKFFRDLVRRVVIKVFGDFLKPVTIISPFFIFFE